MTPSPLRPPSLLRNPISLLGLGVTILSTGFGLPMMFLDMIRRHSSPYIAVLIYLVLPFVAIGGVALLVLGVVAGSMNWIIFAALVGISFLRRHKRLCRGRRSLGRTDLLQ